MKLYIMLIMFLFTACTPNKSYNTNIDNIIKNSKSDNLYQLNIDKNDEFKTLTILVANNYTEEFKTIKYFKKITNLMGSDNLATHTGYGLGHKRYRNTMKLVKNCGNINPNNVPLILFYMKKNNKCTKFNYKNENEFISVLDFLYIQLKNKKVNQKDIGKFQFKQLVREYALSIKLNKTLLDKIERLIDQIYDLV